MSDRKTMGDLEQMLSKNDPQENNLPHGISVPVSGTE